MPRRNFGDFDCSGEDVERDWVARTGCWSRTERVLLTHDQVVNEYGLPATEGKRGGPGGKPLPAATASTSTVPCSGKSKPWSRSNSGAWS